MPAECRLNERDTETTKCIIKFRDKRGSIYRKRRKQNEMPRKEKGPSDKLASNGKRSETIGRFLSIAHYRHRRLFHRLGNTERSKTLFIYARLNTCWLLIARASIANEPLSRFERPMHFVAEPNHAAEFVFLARGDNEASFTDNPQKLCSFPVCLSLSLSLPRSPMRFPSLFAFSFRCSVLLGNNVGATRFETGDEQFSTPERNTVYIASSERARRCRSEWQVKRHNV